MGEVAGAFDGAPVVGIKIGVEVRAFVVDDETQVGDLVALGGEHTLIEGLDLEQGLDRGFAGDGTQCAIRKVDATGSVKIIGAGQDSQPVPLGYRFGIFIKEAAVRLEVDYSVLFQELAVTLQKKRTGQAAILALHLRVGESQPYFRNLLRSEESIYELDSGAQEGHVREIVLRGELGAFPKAGALDVHSYVVQRRLSAREVNCVLPFSATKLQHDRLGGREHPLVPMPFHWMILQPQAATALRLVKHRGSLRLEKAGESLILREFSKFIVSHFPFL